MSNAQSKYGSSTLESVEVSSVSPMFKVAEDTTFRVGFPLVNDKGLVTIIPVKHYAGELKPGKFYSVRWTEELAKNQDAIDALAVAFGDVKVRWATVIIEYSTNKEGKVSKPVTGSLKGLKLSKKDVQALKAINTSNKLSLTDFYVTTDNAKMQAKQFTAITKDGKPLALWEQNKVQEIDVESDSDEVEVKGTWESSDITEQAWEMVDEVLDTIAKEYSATTVLKMLGEDADEADAADNEDDEDWEEATTSKPVTKPSKSKRKPTPDEDDELEEID